MSKVTATNKKSEYKVIFNYKELDKEESLKRAKAQIKEMTKLVKGWTYVIQN